MVMKYWMGVAAIEIAKKLDIFVERRTNYESGYDQLVNPNEIEMWKIDDTHDFRLAITPEREFELRIRRIENVLGLDSDDALKGWKKEEEDEVY